MKTRIIKHPKLNGGQEFEFFYPVSEGEMDSQIWEILDDGNYDFERKDGGVYLDVGASCGLATLYFSQFAKQVYSLEPSPEVYEALVKNVSHLGNVKTFKTALSDHNYESFLFSDNAGNLPQTFTEGKPGVNHRAVPVACVTTEKFLNDNSIDHVDVMKIDVEEHEYIIFPDPSFGNASKKIDVILGESHYCAQGGFPELIPLLLEEYGYKTTFPKIKTPNYTRLFRYLDTGRGIDKRYQLPSSTIFVAKK